MGAWGHGSFENDDALDWVWELEKSEDMSALEIAIQAVNDEEEYLEIPECFTAIAAAEVVAALRGKPAASLPDEVTAWIQGKPKPTAALIQQTIRAIDRIMDDSELEDVWADGVEPEKWKAAVQGLRSRLH